MKRFLIAGVLALGLTAAAEQRASAWIKFNIGFNIGFESGNNCWLWGLFRNGQVPGCPTDVGCCGVSFGYMPSPYGADGGYGGYGGYDAGHYYDSHAGTPAAAPQGQQGSDQGGQQGESGKTVANPNRIYQPVAYYPNQGYHPSAHYSYPNYAQPYGYTGYGYQAPSYWYGHGYGY